MWGSAIFLSSSGRKHLAPDATGGPRESITRPAEYGRQSDEERRRMARAADAFAIQRDAQERHNAAMKFVFDLFPVALFFVAFKLFDIYTATAAAIGATLLQIGWLKWKRRKVDTMMWISLGIIVVFGGATLALHDETFIKWKPTVLYWLFAASLAGSELLFRRNLIRAMLGSQVRMPDGVWLRLNWSWAAFFTFMGAANLLVAYNFPTDTWVNFKLFGGMGLMLAFVVLQALFLARYIEEKSP